MRKIVVATLCLIMAAGQARAQSAHDFEMGKNMEIFMNIFRDANIFYVDSTDPGKMIRDAADGMLSKLDPYTEYIPESEKDDLEFITTGKYGGIGALIRKSGEWVEISEPYYNSPADKAGLLAGDRILEVDSHAVNSQDLTKVSGMLKGTPGTIVTLKIRPINDTTDTKTVEIKREKIAVPSVPYSGMISDSVGYIKLTGFTEESSQEVRSAFEKLRSENKLSGLVLDLRNNGGGLLSEAARIVGIFVPRNTEVVEIRGKVKEYDSKYKTTSPPIDTKLPIAVLINSSSASASEITAGALQDLDRAVIIGQRSFGKGLVQAPRPIGYNSFLKVTTAKYYIPSGRGTQALDYTHRREDGSVGHVPDSLISEFRTANGRKVYDGGGINPDVKVEPKSYSKFTVIISALGYIDDFANRYAVDNQPVKDGFTVTDGIYDQFKSYMSDKEFEFESATSVILNELRQIAEREKYNGRIAAELDAIAEKIKDDKNAELNTFAPEIKEIIGEAIMNRWFYYQGRVRYSLKNDKEAARAIEVLSDRELYNKIITTQDTEKY